MALGFGIGIPFIRVSRGAAIDAQAQAHFDRVIADGGLVPSGLSGVNAFFTTIKTIYATSDITTAISVGLDAQVLGYKLGAGAGTTAGQAAQKLYSCSGASGDVVQTTAASQPLLLVHSGANYWQGVGVAFNYISSPNAAANQITGNIEINAHFIHRTSGSEQVIIAKNQAATNQAYRLRITNGNNISFTISLDGSTLISVLSTFALTNNQEIWVRCTRNSTTGVMNLFTSNDGITYTLNNTATNASGNIFATTTQLSIGANHNGAGDTFHGKLFRANISNSIGGAPVVDFNPNQYNAATSQTQWTSSTGEIWSIQTGTAKTGFKGVLVDRTILQSNGIATSLRAASINVISEAFTLYNSFKKFNNTLGTETIFELGSGATSSQGINLLVNSFAGFESSNIFANVGRYNNNFSNNSLLLGLRANIFNINNTNEAKPYLFNNVVIAETGSSASNNNTSAVNASAINLLATNAGATNFSQINFNTTILSLSENNTTVITAMYNYIRSINGNSF